MKLLKAGRLWTGLVLLLVVMSRSVITHAAPYTYVANANWDQANCNGTINGISNAVKNGVNVPQGDDVTVSLTNQSSVTLQTSFALGNATPVDGSIAAGATVTKTYANLQSALQFMVYPDPTGQACGYKYNAGQITLLPTAATPAPTPVATPTPTTARASSPTPTPSPSVSPVPSSAVAPVKITTIEVQGKTVTPGEPIEMILSQAITLSGTTTPNGLVTLTFHSTPQTVTTTADSKGNWSYTVSDLAIGSHYVDATVTDPVTNNVSAATRLASFTVRSPATATMTKSASSNTKYLVVAIVAVVALAIAAYFIVRKKQSVKSAPLTKRPR